MRALALRIHRNFLKPSVELSGGELVMRTESPLFLMNGYSVMTSLDQQSGYLHGEVFVDLEFQAPKL